MREWLDEFKVSDFGARMLEIHERIEECEGQGNHRGKFGESQVRVNGKMTSDSKVEPYMCELCGHVYYSSR